MHSTGQTPLDRLPTCTFQTLERAVQAADTIQLGCLVWAVFDNIMGSGEVPPLSGLETYSQILGRLVGKAYKGLHTALPSMYIRLFWHRGNNKGKAQRPRPKEAWKSPALFHDARHEKGLCGVVFRPQRKTRLCGGDQSPTPVHPVDPNIHGMKWMKEHQHSYRDMQLDFWLLLRPLMDGGEESTHQLARRLLSVWHWALAIDPPRYPPTPTSMNIGYWLRESGEEDERQLWIEAYACALQHVAEASVGQRWITKRGLGCPKSADWLRYF